MAIVHQATKKETRKEFLARNLRTAAQYLPEWNHKQEMFQHTGMFRFSSLPIILNGVRNWEDFINLVWSWQPEEQIKVPVFENPAFWSRDLNQDPREEEEILKEMGTVLFLCHYLSALVTNSKISVKWSHLEDGSEKDEWLNESLEFMYELKKLNKPDQLKEIQALGEKMRRLFQAMR